MSFTGYLHKLELKVVELLDENSVCTEELEYNFDESKDARLFVLCKLIFESPSDIRMFSD